jgi:hypothetical protein
MKHEYMTRYFGNNERINEFVIRLITSGRRDVALEINNAIRILGVPAPDMVSSFLEKVRKKYDINPQGFPNRYEQSHGEPRTDWQSYAQPRGEPRTDWQSYKQPRTAAEQHETKAADQDDNQPGTHNLRDAIRLVIFFAGVMIVVMILGVTLSSH